MLGSIMLIILVIGILLVAVSSFRPHKSSQLLQEQRQQRVAASGDCTRRHAFVQGQSSCPKRTNTRGTSTTLKMSGGIDNDDLFKSKGQVIGFWYKEKVVLNSKEMDGVHAAAAAAAAVDVASKLRKIMLRLKSNYMSEDGSKVDYLAMKASVDFQEYIENVPLLRYIDLSTLNDEMRKAFFINIYNCLTIHGLIDGYLDEKAATGTFGRIKFYASISYAIAGAVYSLNDIENGVLRSNRVSAVPLTRPPFGMEDPRLAIMLPQCDPRIHFALNCGANSCPPIAVYSMVDEGIALAEKQQPLQQPRNQLIELDGKQNDEERNDAMESKSGRMSMLDQQLKVATEGFIMAGGVTCDFNTNTVRLSKLFDWYKDDFLDDASASNAVSSIFGDAVPVDTYANDEKVKLLSWIYTNAPVEEKPTFRSFFTQQPTPNIVYDAYDWSINQ